MSRLIQPGVDAPNFKAQAVVDNVISEVKLSDYSGKYLVLLFYPADFTLVCPTEILAFSEAAEQFRKMGTEVLAISCDSANTHLAYIKTDRAKGGLGPVKIPLVADKTQAISRSYGVLKEKDGISFRGLFIIDGRGKIRQIMVNDLAVGRSVDETLRLVQAFKFTDEYGEMCPANWRPGKKTLNKQRDGLIKADQPVNDIINQEERDSAVIKIQSAYRSMKAREEVNEKRKK